MVGGWEGMKSWSCFKVYGVLCWKYIFEETRWIICGALVNLANSTEYKWND